MNKLVSFLLALLFSTSVFAQLNISVRPKTPVKQESFQVFFEVTTETDTEPKISFYPIGLEVLGRSREVSVSSSYINGKFKTSKKINYVYEMVSDQARIAKLKDIEVLIGNKKITHPTVSIKVLSTKKTPASVFLRAELSKESAYIGEGIDLAYYLYTRVPVVQVEFKNFPKLNGFIKRFHKVNDEEQTVEENGVIYKKILKYSGRIYPEKDGTLYIDPLKLNIQYAANRGSPFGNFGLSFSRFRSKTVISKKVEVMVKQLPAENMPPNFTGLVGEHTFNFNSAKDKFVVNEAIEAKLEVQGPGALEKLEAPKVFSDPGLEAFDTKSEFFEVGRSSGRKVFDYTFLARANLDIPERSLKLSYFDPEVEQYKEVEVLIPGITVGGSGQSKSPMVSTTNDSSQIKNQSSLNPSDIIDAPMAPLFSTDYKGIPLHWPKYIIYFLVVIVLLQILELFLSIFKNQESHSDVDSIIKRMKKSGISYSELTFLIYRLVESPQGKSLREIVEASNLNKLDKKYFIETIDALEHKDFSESGKVDKRVKFKSSSFKSLRREISDANS